MKDIQSHSGNTMLSAGWNPVFKSFPEINTPVIVLTDYGKCDVCRLIINEDLRTISWVNDMRPQHSNGNVVAWQYLPVLPACR